MFVVGWLCVPFAVGLGLTVALRLALRHGGLWAALTGLVLAAGFVLYAWLSSPLSTDPYDGCSDCEVYLGHWWEPRFVLFIVGGSFVAWLLGVGVGATVSAFRASPVADRERGE